MKTIEKKLNAAILKQIVTKYFHIVLVTTLVFVIAGFLSSEFILPREYSAEALLYIETGDPQTTQSAVKNSTVIFTDNLILRQFSELDGLKSSPSEIRKRIKVQTVKNSDIIRITVRAETPEIAEKQAGDFAYLCTEQYNSNIAKGTITLVSPPFTEGVPVSPKTVLITLIAGIAGLAGTFLAVIYIEIHDTKVKADDDLFVIYKIPVYAEIMSYSAEKEKYNKQGSKPVSSVSKEEYKYE
jgi:capsular polysaccharide biosynthesis protein